MASKVTSTVEFLEAVWAFVKLRGDTEVWWRGQSDSAWDLVPSIHRNSRGQTYEASVSMRFRRAAPARYTKCPAPSDLIAWLQLMQHYRAPTRLLDWSASPLVALLFAVESLEETDAAVWALDPSEFNQQTSGESLIRGANDAFVIAHANEAFGKVSHGIVEQIAFLGDEIDLRMLVQQGAFTIHHSSRPLNQGAKLDDILTKIVISSAYKKSIRTELFHLGISRSSLFPDLEGLASHLDVVRFED